MRASLGVLKDLGKVKEMGSSSLGCRNSYFVSLPSCNKQAGFRPGREEEQSVCGSKLCSLIWAKERAVGVALEHPCVFPAAEQCAFCSALYSFEKQTGSELRTKMGSNPKVMITF